MSIQTHLTDLRNILVTLYPDQNSVRRIAADAGVEIGRVSFAGAAANDWHALLTETVHQSKLDDLLNVVVTEYGDNELLATLCLRLINRSNSWKELQQSDLEIQYREATKLMLQGDLLSALTEYQRIYEKDPYYQGVHRMIHSIEIEMRQSYVDRFGRVRNDRLVCPSVSPASIPHMPNAPQKSSRVDKASWLPAIRELIILVVIVSIVLTALYLYFR